MAKNKREKGAGCLQITSLITYRMIKPFVEWKVVGAYLIFFEQ